MSWLLGIFSRDNKGEVLEVGDKLLIYIQHQRGTRPCGRQLCSQPQVSPEPGWGLPPAGLREELHRGTGDTAGRQKHKVARANVEAQIRLRLIHLHEH